ncbi:MAG: hypothetical protein GC168_20375 [Candidatus Hydrogenedens sp.]|nr:hypothetical protein [Candidatus Hydrogenedens sp.]
MRMNILAAALALLTAAAQAQTGMGGYASMAIEKAGQITGGFDGTIQEMSGGVSIVLKSDDPEKSDLPIQAGSITFDWPQGQAQPSRIVLSGNVRIKHPDADVSADRADWNFDTGELVFTGNPVMTSARVQGMKGEKMTLDMEKGTFSVTGVSVPMLDLNGAGGAGGADMLRPDAIADMAGLVNALKAAWSAEAASPGKHILSLIESGNRQQLLNSPTNLVVENSKLLLKQLNALLPREDFYNAGAWAGVALGDEAQALAAKETLEEKERTHLNRLAFNAAFAAYMGGGA